MSVFTAARLAASFTYVSPATRRDGPGSAYHVVDGGYYDDYGMTTLTEWLDEGLEGVGRPSHGGAISRVLVIQIRSSPAEAGFSEYSAIQSGTRFLRQCITRP